MAGDSRPRYRQIADDLTARIGAGEFPLQSRLPGKRTLAARYEVSTSTMEKVLRALAADALVQPVRGGGTYVVNSEPSRPKTDRERIGDLERRMDRLERRLEVTE